MCDPAPREPSQGLPFMVCKGSRALYVSVLFTYKNGMGYSVKKRESSRTKVQMTDNNDLFGGAAAKRAAPAAGRAAAVKLSRPSPPQGTPGEAGDDAAPTEGLGG